MHGRASAAKLLEGDKNTAADVRPRRIREAAATEADSFWAEVGRMDWVRLPDALRAGGCAVLLADDNAVVKLVLGVPERDEQSVLVPFRPGVSLAESEMGSNAVGKAVKTKRPQLVMGDPQDSPSPGNWMMAAAPVIGANGKLVGAVALAWAGETSVPPLAVPWLVAVARVISLHHSFTSVEARKARLEVLLDRVFEETSDAVLLLDAQSRLVACSPAAARTLHTTVRPLLKPEVQDLLPEGHPLLTRIKNSAGRGPNPKGNGGAGDTYYDLEVMPVGHAEGEDGQVVTLRHRPPSYSPDQSQPVTFELMIGRSSIYLRSVVLARIASQSSAPVLLTGESGTGKELFAQAIHHARGRARGPLISVNCSATPPDLIASEFFGHAPGAFTGARPDGQIGKFEAANGGTLFLDEIGDMAPEAQCSLLRVLECGYVTPVGSARNIAIDVRVIAATHRDLEKDVAAGRFRGDLYYRLQVLQIALVPLRDRPEDIPLLAEHFLNSFCCRYGRPKLSISRRAMTCLIAYSWPGNIRELQNVLVQAAHLADGSIEPGHLPPRCRNAWQESFGFGRRQEEERIRSALSEEHGNRTRAAARLGMSRRTLYRKLEQYGLIERGK